MKLVLDGDVADLASTRFLSPPKTSRPVMFIRVLEQMDALV